MTHTYAISAPEVKHDLIWATGHDSDGVIKFTTRDGSCDGVFWPEGRINVAGTHGSWPAELVWQGEVPKPYSLNYASAVSWIKTQIAVEKTRVAESQPDPAQTFFARVESKLDEVLDMYKRAAAEVYAQVKIPGPRKVGKVPELAAGYGNYIVEDPEDKELTKFLEGVVGSVEASDFEYFSLYEDEKSHGSEWKENLSGIWRNIGSIADRPVCVSLRTAEINGAKILFWHPTSPMVDYDLIEAWLKRVLPKTAIRDDNHLKRTDAMNFCNIVPRPSKVHD